MSVYILPFLYVCKTRATTEELFLMRIELSQIVTPHLRLFNKYYYLIACFFDVTIQMSVRNS